MEVERSGTRWIRREEWGPDLDTDNQNHASVEATTAASSPLTMQTTSNLSSSHRSRL